MQSESDTDSDSDSDSTADNYRNRNQVGVVSSIQTNLQLYIYTYKAPPPFSQTRPTSRSLWRCAGAFWSLLFLFNGRRRRLAGETEAAAILPSLGFRLPILHLHRDCEFRFPKSPCSYMKVLKLGLWFFFFFNIGLKFVAFDICLLSLV